MTRRQKIIFRRTILRNPYVKNKPTFKQALALFNNNRELFYGGAAGGGKSDFLLMSALQWVKEPNYSALIIRKTFADLSKPGSLIPRSHDWLAGTDARWNGTDKQWIFPSGAVLAFGHLEHENDKYKYQGGEFKFIGIDELPHLTETQYLYLFSRLRKEVDSIIPSKIRSTGNPDGTGFEWVKSRFVDPGDESRPFISSKLEDNPHLDIADYVQSLDLLDPITKAKLKDGDWSARREGEFFKTTMIQVTDDIPDLSYANSVRRWDLASTPEPNEGSSNDPDYTVGLKVCIFNDELYILDVVRGRWGADDVDRHILQTAQLDGIETQITCEEEPGSSGKRNTEYLRKMLRGYSFQGVRSTGKKDVRARPVASWINQGKCKMLRAPWNRFLLDEMVLFPFGSHDDQVDTLSGGFNDLSTLWTYEDGFTNQGIGAQYENEVF